MRRQTTDSIRQTLIIPINIKLSEVIFIWFSALSSTLYPAFNRICRILFHLQFLFVLSVAWNDWSFGFEDCSDFEDYSDAEFNIVWLCCVQILLVSDRNSYIINMCLTIISLTDAFLGLFLRPVSSF